MEVALMYWREVRWYAAGKAHDKGNFMSSISVYREKISCSVVYTVGINQCNISRGAIATALPLFQNIELRSFFVHAYWFTALSISTLFTKLVASNIKQFLKSLVTEKDEEWSHTSSRNSCICSAKPEKKKSNPEPILCDFLRHRTTTKEDSF